MPYSAFNKGHEDLILCDEYGDMNLSGFIKSDNGAIAWDWAIIGACMVGLVGSSVYTAMQAGDATQPRAPGFAAAAIGDIGCTISGVFGAPCAVRPTHVVAQVEWNNWCSRPGGLQCSFTETQFGMSDGTIWTQIDIRADNGVRRTVWRDSTGATTEPPALS